MKKMELIDFKFRAKPWTVVSGGQNFTETHVLPIKKHDYDVAYEWAKKNLPTYFGGGYTFIGIDFC